MQTTRGERALLVAVSLGLTLAACADTPPVTSAEPAADMAADMPMADMNDHSGAHATKGFIGGWLDGEDAQLRYTRMYFCEEPPASAVPSDCEVGAPAEITPREGPIPYIYAIVAAGGIKPLAETLHCPGGKVCTNHPATLDLTRVGGMGGPHSHILRSRQGGWHQTVNIRVTNLDVWNQIAAAKSYAKVYELQHDPLTMAFISQDTPTNVFFFLEVQKPH